MKIIDAPSKINNATIRIIFLKGTFANMQTSCIIVFFSRVCFKNFRVRGNEEEFQDMIGRIREKWQSKLERLHEAEKQQIVPAETIDFGLPMKEMQRSKACLLFCPPERLVSLWFKLVQVVG